MSRIYCWSQICTPSHHLLFFSTMYRNFLFFGKVIISWMRVRVIRTGFRFTLKQWKTLNGSLRYDTNFKESISAIFGTLQTLSRNSSGCRCLIQTCFQTCLLCKKVEDLGCSNKSFRVYILIFTAVKLNLSKFSTRRWNRRCPTNNRRCRE